jgi:hypothetical protein
MRCDAMRVVQACDDGSQVTIHFLLNLGGMPDIEKSYRRHSRMFHYQPRVVLPSLAAVKSHSRRDWYVTHCCACV